MRNVFFSACAGGLLVLLGTACGSSGGNTGGSGATGGSTGTMTSTLGCPDNLTAAPASEFCKDEATTPDCTYVTPNYHTQVCGVPVLDPTTELARASGVKEFGGSGPPDLGCFDSAHYPQADGPSQMVTMKGVVKIFSHGCETKNVAIEVYTVKDADLSAKPVGTPITTSSDCKADGVASDDSGGDCGTRYECNYAYANVPTGVELAVLTKGDFWAPLYTYNIYIPNAEVQNGVWKHDIRALATDDYSVIPQAAIGSPITPGNGAIAGEVHDCGDVRLQNATVDVEVQKRIVTYFTSNEDHPLPDTAATSTSILGLYAALDVPPGKASVAALGMVNGQLTTVGYHRVTVFPDSVTAITFQGVRPFQVSP